MNAAQIAAADQAMDHERQRRYSRALSEADERAIAEAQARPARVKRQIRREGTLECYLTIGVIFVLFAVLYVCLALNAGTWGW